MITKFEVQPRANPSERNKVLELEFMDGSKQRFNVINTDKRQEFTVQHVKTNYVIIRFVEVYGTINNGGAFNIFGIECKNLSIDDQNSKENERYNGILKAAGITPKKLPALFKEAPDKPISLNCKDSFATSTKFKKTKMALGNSVLVNCYSSCSFSPYPIYGTSFYTKDSVICKAAFHDKKITAVGGLVKFPINILGESSIFSWKNTIYRKYDEWNKLGITKWI